MDETEAMMTLASPVEYSLTTVQASGACFVRVTAANAWGETWARRCFALGMGAIDHSKSLIGAQPAVTCL
jgi:hypothetical protein